MLHVLGSGAPGGDPFEPRPLPFKAGVIITTEDPSQTAAVKV